MMLLVVLSIILVGTNAALDKELLEKFRAEIHEVGIKCAEDEKASEEDIAALISRNVPDSHQGKCVIFCTQKHFNIQNDDGKFNKEAVFNLLEKLKPQDIDIYNKAVQIANTCFAKVNDDGDPCDSAADMFTCSNKEAAVVGIDESLMAG